MVAQARSAEHAATGLDDHLGDEDDAKGTCYDVSEGVRPFRWHRLAPIDRWLAVVLLAAPILGLIGVTTAELVADDHIAHHLVDARDAELIGGEDTATPLGTAAARYTECTAFSLGLGDQPGEGLVARALVSPAYVGCGRLLPALKEYEDSAALRPGFQYVQYWHGYTVITRPLLAATGAAGARWVAYAFSLLAVGGMCAAVKRSFGGLLTLVLVVPPLLTSDMVIAGLSGSTAIGGTSAYLDLMTTMPGALALTAVGATLGACSTNASVVARQTWTIAAAAVAGWTLGLAWMWGWKWLMASAILGFDEVRTIVRAEIEFRLSSGTYGVTDSRVDGLTKNLEMWWRQPLTSWVVAATLTVVTVATITAFVRRRRKRVRWDVAVGAVIAGLAVLAWYVALNNHSQIHPGLVYRSLPIAFGGACALAYVALRGESARSRS